MKTRSSRFGVYGLISLSCSAATLIAFFLLWLKEARDTEIERGVFDIPLEFLIMLYAFPFIHAVGFLSGLRSFWLQPNAIGIGLWAMTISLLLLLFDFFIWFKWTS